MKKLSFLLAVFIVSGCVIHKGHDASFDGLSNEYSGDATVFATHVVDELSLRYAPARTNVNLTRVPGVFGDSLETELRKRGFGVAPNSGLGLTYHIDVLDESQPVMGYVQIKTSDGRIFSFSREVFKGTVPEGTLPDLSNVSEKPVPQASEPVPPMQTADDRETLTRGGTAKQVAKRNHVPVDKFCAWNNLTTNTKLSKGSKVYLHKPSDFVEPVAATPAPAPEVKEKAALKQESLPRAQEPASAPAPQKIDTSMMNVAQNSQGTNTVNQNAAKTYTVKKKIKAGRLADQLGLNKKNFLEWNSLGSNAELAPGYVVFVSKPGAGTIPVAQNSVTPSSASQSPLPAKSGTTPKSGSSEVKPQPAAPVPTPLSVTPAAASTPLPSEDMSRSTSTNPSVFNVSGGDFGKSWEILGGTMLKTNMENWAALAGYSLIWNPANDYELRSSATFYGDYIQAMQEFFAQLQASGLALRVNIYQGNHVTEISDN